MQNLVCLLVDDDSDDQEIFSLAVSKTQRPAECVFADDGMHAIEKLKGDKNFVPDFIFIDMNMPRMNGQECLSEIKKIDHLKNVPVYMYSTSTDPETIMENKRLGATDFIVKPSDINVLTDILKGIIQKPMMAIFTLMVCCCMIPGKSMAQDTLPAVQELKKLSVEELMDIVVTSVSRSPERLSEVASAIQVITADDVRRSTATRLPEALRLATNLQVAQSGAHDWGITARGFNGAAVASSTLANKLLVQIDGRSVYTPLFGGVYWDVQNILLEDLDQIEVISGPGGSLWGANAVNGIINITTKSARQTQGLYATAAAGTFLRDHAAVRYGGHIDTTFFYRVYAQRYDYNSTRVGNHDARDDWNMSQGGFRMDFIPGSKNSFTLQGDLYAGSEDDTAATDLNGQNVIGRWNHTFSTRSEISLQVYFDRTFRDIPFAGTRAFFRDELSTSDMDFQHNLTIGKRNKFVWGFGYRQADNFGQSDSLTIRPQHKTLHNYSVFIQDQISIIPQRLDLTAGTKVLHNDFTGFEVHPSIRLAWTPNIKNTIWAAVSQGVRTPSRFDADLYTYNFHSIDDYKSEKVIAYELGYRTRPVERLSVSLAGFYNSYTDLRSLDSFRDSVEIFYFGNNLEATSYGAEISSTSLVTDWWKLRGGYTYLYEKFKSTGDLTFPETERLEAIDPQNQFLVQSMITVKYVELDGMIRYVDVLPRSFTVMPVPSYITYDIRIAYNYKWFNIAVSGQHLAQKSHLEFGTHRIPRRLMAKISITF